VCLVLATVSLYGVARCASNFKIISKISSNNKINTKNKELRKMISSDITEYNRFGKAMSYILGLVVVQGTTYTLDAV